jgi:quinol-cytochrome oxidoreductase complex cytochrome b subunit
MRERWTRIVSWIGVGALVALALTGVWLTRYYRPSVVRFYTWSDRPPDVDRSLRWADAIRRLHNTAAFTFLFAAAAYGALVFRARVRAVAAVAAVVGAVGGFASGIPLAWDQLALRAVTIHSNFNGVWTAAFSDQVRFVLIGHSEMSQTAYRTWLLAHLIAVPAVLVVTGRIALRRSRPAPPDAPAD